MPRTLGTRKRSTLKRKEVGKRYPLNMRTTWEMRERLEVEARASGRSLAQEVEFRLQQSIKETDYLLEEFGGAVAFKLMKSLAGLASATSKREGKDWLRHAEVFDAVVGQWYAALGKLRPRAIAPKDAPWAQSPWNLLDHIKDAGTDGARAILEIFGEELKDKSLRAALEEAYEAHTEAQDKA
jgi:hypothetical protein